MSKEWLPRQRSRNAANTSNPIRKIVDMIKKEPNPDKAMIPLSIGDPTVFGNLKTHSVIVEALKKSVEEGKANGYAHACGQPDARAAIAKKFSPASHPISAEDVIITSGCSGALQISIDAIANRGQNILLPAPGFSLYQTICDNLGIETRHYRCLPEREWQIDLDHVESLIDGNTAAWLVNNPSNPCGSVLPKEHLQRILAVADKHRVPLIADQIYANMVFSGHEYHSLAELSENVPVLECGGIAKQYLVPGWRVGWIIVHDRNGILADVKDGAMQLATVLVGSNTLVQSTIPDILHTLPAEYYAELNTTLEAHATAVYKKLQGAAGLNPVKPSGAMYIMVGIDLSRLKDIQSDVDFTQKLLTEQSVFVLPGSVFKMDNFIRLVTSPPLDKLNEACDRIVEFCAAHSK